MWWSRYDVSTDEVLSLTKKLYRLENLGAPRTAQGHIAWDYRAFGVVDNSGKVRQVFVHSKKYMPVQNGTAIELLLNAVGVDKFKFARVTVNYRHMFAEFYWEHFKVGDEEFYAGVMLKNSYDGSWAFSMQGGLLRLVCENGALAPYGQEYLLARYLHVGQVNQRVRLKMDELLKVSEAVKLFKQFVEIAQDTRLTEELLKKLFKKQKSLIEWYEKMMQRAKALTVWELYNYVTQAARDRLRANKVRTAIDYMNRANKLAEALLKVTVR